MEFTEDCISNGFIIMPNKNMEKIKVIILLSVPPIDSNCLHMFHCQTKP